MDLSSNHFRGSFPHWICKLKDLISLDLSNNLFNGSIPPCLRNSIDYLTDMILSNNSFSGTLPDIFSDATNLQMIDVGRNHLEGNLPKSLIHCKALQLVNVEYNRIKDKYPSWLGSLPSLNVLSLRSNKFYGPLYQQNVSIGFQSLCVMDLSHNDLSGTLPPSYFSNWLGITKIYNFTEMVTGYNLRFGYSYDFRSMEMVNKGIEMRPPEGTASSQLIRQRIQR
ncbi:receptor like protein 11 [Raphanus sativus]|nr:receptor like protein 11 [Raphanus sativus]